MTSDGKYVTLNIMPTVNKDDTSYKAEGQYIDSDKIRIDSGRIEQIGGWQARTLSRSFTGVARDIITWKELRDMPHLAAGTHQKLEIEQLGTLYDITPVEVEASVSDAITTVSGATSVLVSAPSHGRAIGDFIVFESVADVSVGGIDLQGNEYQITSTPSGDSYVINVNTPATSDVSSGGGTTIISHLLQSGRRNNGTAYGWGAGTWGTPGATASSGWSDPRGGDGITVKLRQWSLDLWGEDLIACPRGGRVYHWDATTSVTTRASAIDAIPLSNNVVFTHPNRHLVLLGTWPVGASAMDPLEIRWSDRDNFRNFQVSAATRAGTFRLQGSGNEIKGYAISKRETLIFTDSAIWTMRPLNNTLVFGFDNIDNTTGLLAQHAVAAVDGKVYWWGRNNFYIYDGQVQNIPSGVRDFVFNRLNQNQKEKTFAGVNKDNNEIMWLYQSNESTTGDIDSYVKYNYKEGMWDIGTFDRLVWEDSGVYPNPIAINASGVAYDHEVGNTADGAAINSFIESSYFDIEDGTDMMLVDQLIPDFVLSGNLNFSITVKKWPGGPEETKGPFAIGTATEQINFRARGRQAKIRYSTSTLGTEWGLGKPRYRVTTDGER